MSNVAKILVFVLASVMLLADVLFIVWATQLNVLIVMPALLSASYLAYLVAHYTVLGGEMTAPYGKAKDKRGL